MPKNPIAITDIYGNVPLHIFKPIKAVAITAGTPVAVWTPTTGTRFRLLGFCVMPTVAASILFEDATGGTNEFLRFPLTAAVPTAQVIVRLHPWGYLSTTVNNALFLDVTATATVSGFVYGTEE
jgi:hypothetical protein